MPTNQANPHTVVDAAAGGAQIRELSLSELAQVAGGLPHGTWATVGPEQTVSSQGPDPLPHGTW